MTAIQFPFGTGGGAPGPPGPQGPAGPMQQMASQGQWAWRAAPTADGLNLTTGEAAVDTDSPRDATHLFLYCDDVAGMDHTPMVESMRFGDSVFVFVMDDVNSWHEWSVVGTPVKNVETWAIPVVTYAGSAVGTEPPDLTGVVFQFRDTASVPSGGTTEQVLGKLSDASGDVGWETPTTTDLNLRWVQMAPATTWTITHNLGFWPSVTVVDSNKREIIPDVSFPDVNSVALTFSAAVAGEAFLS